MLIELCEALTLSPLSNAVYMYMCVYVQTPGHEEFASDALQPVSTEINRETMQVCLPSSPPPPSPPPLIPLTFSLSHLYTSLSVIIIGGAWSTGDDQSGGGGGR